MWLAGQQDATEGHVVEVPNHGISSKANRPKPTPGSRPISDWMTASLNRKIR